MPPKPPRRRTVDLIDKRVGLLFGLFLMLLLVAGARAAYLGTFRAGALSAAAAEEHIQTVSVPAVRGEILDRNGDPLAISESTDEMIADPLLIPARHAAGYAKQLAPLLHVSQQKLLGELTKPGTGFVILTKQTPAADADRVMALDINGISRQPSTKRDYPLGTLGASMIGWLNSEGRGASGLEDVFNRQLQGTAGSRRIVDAATGKAISVDNTKTMVPGKNLKLTISVPLESEVQSVLQAAAKAYRPQGATAIVTDPQTDQILALANWPTMNSNDVTADDLKSINGSVPAIEDMAVQFSYEPGSTFKPVTIGGALQDGVITPSSEINVPSILDIDGDTIADAESHPDEHLTPGQILKVSSNIGADEVGQRLGINRFYAWVKRFGFGTPTGVPLNGESSGIVQPESSFYTDGTLMYNAPFGQGESVTPMQMVQLYDTVADGGVLRTPQLVESVGRKAMPEPAGKRIVSTTVAAELRNMMRGVFADGGTASGAAIPGYDMAGKTGTAQVSVDGRYSNSLYNGSFIGMVPASDPKLVVAVVMAGVKDGVGYGGTVAAPVFQKIVGWAVPHLGINPCPKPCPKSAWQAPTANSL